MDCNFVLCCRWKTKKLAGVQVMKWLKTDLQNILCYFSLDIRREFIFEQTEMEGYPHCGRIDLGGDFVVLFQLDRDQGAPTRKGKGNAVGRRDPEKGGVG